MPQSSAALRQKADTLRLLRNPHARVAATDNAGRALARPVRAKRPFVCQHGQCLALEIRQGSLWVLVQPASGEAGWAPIDRILAPGQQRDWAREGFG